MKVGTKSLLYGYHCPLWHTFIIAFAWWKLYGFPWNPKLWICFLMHDIGYWGKSDMDGETGAYHPIYGAYIVSKLLGDKWALFCMFHSRRMIEITNTLCDILEQHGTKVNRPKMSKLCIADKLAILYTPKFLNNKDELREYMKNECTENKDNYFNKMYLKVREFVESNKDVAYGPNDY